MRARRLLFATACAMLPGLAAATPSATPDRVFQPSSDRELADLRREEAPYIEKARATLPAARERFAKGLGKRYEFYVTTRLHDARGREEQVFVLVDGLAPGGIRGRLATKPLVLLGHRRGEGLSLDDAQLVDWTITDPQGAEEGNFVGNFMDRYAPSEERCGVITTDAKGAADIHVLPGWHVSGPDAPKPFALPAGLEGKPDVVQCLRRSIVPFLADVDVIAAGLPVSLTDDKRVSKLEVVDGRLRLRMLEGEMTDAEIAGAQVLLDAGRRLLDKAGE